MAALLRSAGVGHAALHDLLLLYASVQRWVGLAESAAFNPTLANVRGSCVGVPGSALAPAAAAPPAQQAVAVPSRCKGKAPPDLLPQLPPVQGEEGERYRPQFLWALLAFWCRAPPAATPPPG